MEELRDLILNTIVGEVMFFDMDTLMEDLDYVIKEEIEGDVVDLGMNHIHESFYRTYNNPV